MENKVGYIFLDKGTAFHGEISTGRLVLEGVVEGEIRATREVFLKEGAIVQGGIATPKYLVEEGSVHHGKLTMGEQKTNGSVEEAIEKAKSEFMPVGEVVPPVKEESEEKEMEKKYSSAERLW